MGCTSSNSVRKRTMTDLPELIEDHVITLFIQFNIVNAIHTSKIIYFYLYILIHCIMTFLCIHLHSERLYCLHFIQILKTN